MSLSANTRRWILRGIFAAIVSVLVVMVFVIVKSCVEVLTAEDAEPGWFSIR